MATVFERVKKVVVEQLGVEDEEVKPEASFADDLNADSLDLAELVMAFEEEFGNDSNPLKIPDEDAEHLLTVEDVIDYLKEHGFEDD